MAVDRGACGDVMRYIDDAHQRQFIEGAFMLKRSTGALWLLLVATLARADSGADYTFQSLHPQFLTSEITPAVWQYESAVSPATYEAAQGDFLSRFTSPGGKQVSVVVKAPV